MDTIKEASYSGNIGMMEMYKFFKAASVEQKRLLKSLLSDGDTDGAWNLIQDVTGTQLHSMNQAQRAAAR